MILKLQQIISLIFYSNLVTMPTYFTPNRHGYSLKFSPFNPDHVVVATSQYYGLAGGGSLFLLETTSNGAIHEKNVFDWSDGLFDVVWSEQDMNIVVTASGDGSLQMWNLFDSVSKAPFCCYNEHKKEVYSVDWSRTSQLLLSASWDCSIKLWDPTRFKSLHTYIGHSQLVYNAMFSPFIPNTFASVSGDGQLKLWNTLGDQRRTTSITAHDGEVLTCDWSKKNHYVLATGGSDGLIKGWDIRNLGQPIFELIGCEYAVRRIQFSPFDEFIIASVSYDSTTRLWNYNYSDESIEVIQHHSEFNYGLDWNRLRQNEIGDCGWDSLVQVFTPKCLQRTNNNNYWV